MMILAFLLEHRKTAIVEEYLTLDEVCRQIGYKKQSIYNFIYRGILISGIHYVKPRGKLLFKASALQKWLNRSVKKKPKSPAKEEIVQETSKIRI